MIAFEVVLVVALLTPGIAMGAYSVHKIQELEENEDALEARLDEQEKQVFATNKRIDLLHKEVKELAQHFDILKEDLNNLKENSVRLSYAMSYLWDKLEKKFDEEWIENEKEIKEQQQSFNGFAGSDIIIILLIALGLLLIAAAVGVLVFRLVKRTAASTEPNTAQEQQHRGIITT
ncbi:unnamed protein product [Orchesella dallaii]|uniref:Uncharacterized protein n=1 Tax=Orchesella dallaii TaxID=48710 RepID=A0ABP1S2J0_9HEXA